jgi:hypothetical protein
MLFKNPARTSKRTPHFTIAKINWLTLFKEIIAVYSKSDTKYINTNEVLLILKAAGTYSYHSALKVKLCSLFEYRVLKTIFGRTRYEVTEGCR